MKNKKKYIFKKIILTLFLVFSLLFLVNATESKKLGKVDEPAFIYTKGGYAIDGYDPIAYFKKGEPTKGTKEYIYTWQKAQWLFSSKENLEAFAQNPKKFAPQYGGHCAYAAAKNYIAKSEGDAWSIKGGKLYLNYNLSVRALWRLSYRSYIKDGDKNWPVLRRNK